MVGWDAKPLGEVCHFVRGPFGGSLKKEVFVDEGFAVYEQQHAIYDQFDEIRYFVDGAKFAEMQRFELRPNDLIMSCSGTMGRVAIAPMGMKRGIINQALLKMTPSEAVVPGFLKYWMTSSEFQASLTDQAGGVAIQNVASVSVLKQIKMPIPPRAEQQRIVAMLDEAFEGIATAKANAEKNLQNARELLDSFVDAVFSRVGETSGRRRLGDIVDRLTNGFVGPTRDIYVEQGVPYLLARHVRNNRLTFDGRTFVRPEFNERHKKSKLKRGDVLLVQSGHIGHTAVVGTDHEGHNCHAMIVMTPVGSVLVGEYLSYFFSSPQMRQSFESIRSGSTVPHLTCGAVRELGIPLPPIDHQRELVGQIEELESETSRLRKLAAAKTTALDDLKKSMLHQAFSGSLTNSAVGMEVAEVA
jgi:type I restriction enzyme, S subunit